MPQEIYADLNIPIAKFTVLAKIGGGAQGSIYRVQEKHSGKEIALKALRITETDPVKKKEMFTNLQNEFRILRKLKHGNIISVDEFGFSDDHQSCYYTMEYLPGTNLMDYFQQHNDEASFVDLAYQALSGLAYLHSNQIIHYDIKPENILICTENGKPVLKILDFGLSDLKIRAGITKARGSLNYMAPEFFIPDSKITERTDLYSLGVSLLTAFQGRQDSSELSVNLSVSQIIKHINTRSNQLEKQLLCIQNYRIKKFISALVQQNPGLRTASAIEALRQINYIFNTTLEIPDIAAIQLFADNSTFLLREKMLQELQKELTACRQQKESVPLIFIRGRTGNGKTRIIEQLYYHEMLAGQRILKISCAEKQPEKYFILRKICSLLPNEMPRKFNAVLPDCNFSPSAAPDYLLDQLLVYLRRCLEEVHLTVIFDDLEHYDSASLELIISLISTKELSNFTAIPVYDEELLDASSLSALEGLRQNKGSFAITIEPLSAAEIKKIKQLFIGDLFHEPEDLIKGIYAMTQGSFLKTMQFFDLLFELKIIKRMQRVYVFDNEPRFRQLLTQNLTEIYEARLAELDLAERTILAVLIFFPQSVSTRDSIFYQDPKTETVILPTMHNLAAKGMVCKKKGLTDEISISSEELKEHLLLSVLSTAEILNALRLHETVSTADADLSAESFKSRLSLLYSLLNTAETTDLEQTWHLLENLTSSADLPKQQKKLLLLTAEKISAPDSIINLQAKLCLANLYLAAVEREAAGFWLKQAASHPLNGHSPTLYARYLFAKLRFFQDKDDCSEFYTLVSENFSIMRLNIDKDTLYRSILATAYQMINQDRNYGEKIYALIKEKLDCDTDVDPQYRYLIEIIEYIYKIKVFSQDNWSKLREQLIYLTARETLNSTAGGYFRFYIELALRNPNKEHNRFIEQVLEDLSTKPDKITDSEVLAGIYNLASVFFYNCKEFEKAYNFLSRQYEIVRKMSSGKSNALLGNMATFKMALFHNINETMEIFEHSVAYYKQYGPPRNTVMNNLNYALCCFKGGKLADGKKHLLNALSDTSFIAWQAILPQLERLNYFTGYLITENEYLKLADNALNHKAISAENHAAITDNILKMYKRIHDDIIEPGGTITYSQNGELNISAPAQIIKYLKAKDILPDIEEVFTPGYKTPPKAHTGDYLLHLIVRHIYSPADVMLQEIYDYFKKMEIAGYQFRVFELVIPFVEFLFYKNEQMINIKRFLVLQRNGEQFLFDNMDDLQKQNFCKSQLYRKAIKNLKRMKIIYEKLKSASNGNDSDIL